MFRIFTCIQVLAELPRHFWTAPETLENSSGRAAVSVSTVLWERCAEQTGGWLILIVVGKMKPITLSSRARHDQLDLVGFSITHILRLAFTTQGGLLKRLGVRPQPWRPRNYLKYTTIEWERMYMHIFQPCSYQYNTRSRYQIYTQRVEIWFAVFTIPTTRYQNVS